MDNQRQLESKEFYIPMEVTEETIKDFAIDRSKVMWSKMSNRSCRVIMVKATEEQYRAYMRPLWREEQYVRRHGNGMLSSDAVREGHNGGNTTESDKRECIMLTSNQDIAEDMVYKEAVSRLQEILDSLEELDRKIVQGFYEQKTQTEIGRELGLKQRTVSNKIRKIFAKMSEECKDFKKILLSRC